MAYERKYKVTKSTVDLYKFYKNKLGEEAIKEDLFKKIYYDLNKSISNLIIKESLEYKLPYRLGYLRIKKTKLKLKLREGHIDLNKNLIDWDSTWKYWLDKYPGLTRKDIKKIPNKKCIFHMNEHTDGDIMSWFWDKYYSNAKNNTVYKFQPVKGGIIEKYYLGRLGLGAWIKSEEKTNDYYY